MENTLEKKSNTVLQFDFISEVNEITETEKVVESTRFEDIPSKKNTTKVKSKIKSLPPMLKSYLDMKKKYPDHLLLYQVGDFYELFFDDAVIAAEILSIRLTSRNKEEPEPIPMAGVPIHAIDNYLPKILQAHKSCVIVSQVEDAATSKGMVKREITRIVTPGVRYEGDGLDEKSFNYLACVCFSNVGGGAVSYIDVSTGHLRIQEFETLSEMIEGLKRVRPAEIIAPLSLNGLPVEKKNFVILELKKYAKETGVCIVFRPFDFKDKTQVKDRLNLLLLDSLSSSYSFNSAASTGASLSNSIDVQFESLSKEGCSSIVTILDYVNEVSFSCRPSLSQFSVEEISSVVFIDEATRRNLEISEARIDGDKRHSLIYSLDNAKTAMGSRLLAEWILSPSRIQEEIAVRHDAVEELQSDNTARSLVREVLIDVRDLDRILSRIASLRATPRDLGILKESIQRFTEIEQVFKGFKSSLLKTLSDNFDPLGDVYSNLASCLQLELPTKSNEGGIFLDGYNQELDRLRDISRNARKILSELEQKEKNSTGISTLKIKYNNVFGYFIEVSKLQSSKVPASYERRQTLTNAERYVTPELKELESEILSSKARQFELERQLFVNLRENVSEASKRINKVSRILSILDVLSSFAELARQRNYVRPQINLDSRITIVEGRHPVVERIVGEGNFVSNDVSLNQSNRRFAILTGPNMGGKSTYLRQVGLIQVMAQAGSFVPAREANVPLVDRIFTRIGSSDDLAKGDSTFMVEMREAAVITKKSTKNSLVLIDEIGRGTATADGFALARAIAEWLHDVSGSLTVFATHFHELTFLAEEKNAAFCLSVGVKEKDSVLNFTHRIEEKAADRSYGIEVAKLAGLPENLLKRARILLEEARNQAVILEKKLLNEDSDASEYSLNFDSQNSKLLELSSILGQCNLDHTTPIEALGLLHKLKSVVD